MTTTLAKELIKIQKDVDIETENINSEQIQINESRRNCRDILDISCEIPRRKLLPKLISDKILRSLKNGEGMWNSNYDMVYIKMRAPLVLKYEFYEIRYRDEQCYCDVGDIINETFIKIHEIYNEFTTSQNIETIYHNIDEMELETINNELKQSGIELLVLSANPNYGEKIKINAHAILRVI